LPPATIKTPDGSGKSNHISQDQCPCIGRRNAGLRINYNPIQSARRFAIEQSDDVIGWRSSALVAPA
jgi:hypothetical protein